MTVPARDVAAVLRDRMPGLPTKKLHKLLYYCQGHHLAGFGAPLFTETVSAWDMGPVVGQLWHQEKEDGVSSADAALDESEAERAEAALSEAELNTIGYVLSRYGALTAQDLENLTHSEAPWRQADSTRRPRESVRIEAEWLVDYFRTDGAAENEDDDEQGPLDSEAVTRWLVDARNRSQDDLRVDSQEDLRARLSPSA